MNFSQSLLKDWMDYDTGLMCGLLFEAKHIKKTVQIPSSAIQRAGQWLEWLCSGATLRDGSIPPTEFTAKGKKREQWWIEQLTLFSSGMVLEKELEPEGELSAMYCKLLKQAIRFRDAIIHYGITIKSTGVVIGKQFGEYSLKGILDVAAEMNSENIIIDIKSTGLIDDRWSDMGWDLATLPDKRKLMIQPKFYRLLTPEPFYFFVHSNTNEVDFRIIRVDISEETMERFRDWLSETIDTIMSYVDFGFTPRPSVKQCCYLYKDDDGNYCRCPLYDGCKHKTSVPQIQSITLLS